MKFWFNIKSKKLETFEDSTSHARFKKIDQMCGDDEECSDYRMKELQNLGYIRGFFSPRRELALSISSQYQDNIEQILGALPYEYLLVNKLVIDVDGVWDLKNLFNADYEIEVDLDDGEDALKAWQRRNSLRKQYAKISFRDIVKFSNVGAVKFWFNMNNGEFNKFDAGKTHYYALTEDSGEDPCFNEDDNDLDHDCVNRILGDAQYDGLVRGYYEPGNVLNLGTVDMYKDKIGYILSKIPYEYTLVKELNIDFSGYSDLETSGGFSSETVKVDKGEDAIVAWKNRKSLRKKVRATIQLSKRDV